VRYKNIGVLIPYLTTDGDRAMMRLRFRGDVDRRRMRREMRRHLRYLGIRPETNVLDSFIAHRSYDLGLDSA
jgi:hypothetical protein